ncbi:restriction endonuclease subunit S [Myroides sp. 1354]|uniref:restriction endonuclease subunit S n=1 Tax=unclassified Myroides TaxID=2642485 RepID=UPI002576E694|nr:MULTISPECIES: restriction endonuclease subunit S [unclassified Myroides]MDM1056021.1 restriction endonuclease subunit S [Myroides sp. 1354]MDM1069030.1 restriction endonuclease subunit S [Myroides sp. 1372]
MRFPEFTEEWETKKLGEIGDVKMCRRIFNDETEPMGDIPFFKIGSFGKEADAFISKELYLDYRKRFSFPKKGDILISAAGTIGRTVVYDGNDAYFQDSNIVWIDNDNKNITNEFLYYILQIVKYNTEGGTIQRLYNNVLKSTKFSSPSIQEQEKISTFLSLVDKRIQTQNKIIGQLETLIKGLCQKLILKQVPNKKLSDCVSCYSSSLTESNVIDKNGVYPVYGATGVIAFTENPQINEDAVLIIKDGSGVGKVQYASDKFSVIGTLNYLTVKPDVNLKYIFFCLKFFNFEKYKVGSGIPHIYFKDYGESLIFCPSLDEQGKIEKLLSSIDEKIKIEKTLLKKYEIQKKNLLQNLFI